MELMSVGMKKYEAVFNLRPTGKFRVSDGELDWLGDIADRPTDAEVDAEMERLQADYDSKQYQRDRKAEYDKLNQFEMQFDDQRDGTTTWVDAINGIKDKYPKE